MTIVRAAQSTTSLTSEALRARVIQAGATSQAAKPEVSSSSTSMEELTASASVIYRQRQNEVPKDNTYVHLQLSIDPRSPSPWMDKDIREKQKAIDVNSTFNSMDKAYKEFKSSLQRVAPNLAKLDFGFTLNPQGDLIATGVSGQQKTELTKLLNQSEGLKELASEFANKVMKWGQADTYLGFGQYKLNAENFQNTINIGEALDASNGNIKKGIWVYQFSSKGEIDLEKKEKMKPYAIEWNPR